MREGRGKEGREKNDFTLLLPPTAFLSETQDRFLSPTGGSRWTPPSHHIPHSSTWMTLAAS